MVADEMLALSAVMLIMWERDHVILANNEVQLKTEEALTLRMPPPPATLARLALTRLPTPLV